VLRSEVHLSLELQAMSASTLAFWGKALAEADKLRLSLDMRLSSVDEQDVQQLAAAAGGTLPGVVQLTVMVRLLCCALSTAAMFNSSTDCWPACPQASAEDPISISGADLGRFPALERLTLDNTWLSSPWAPSTKLQLRGADMNAAELCPGLQAATSLTVLEISDCLHHPAPALLARALRDMPQLMRLGLDIAGPMAAATIAPALQGLTALTGLKVGRHARQRCLGPEGMAALAPALQTLTGLQQL
jgi:hypothetical protein